MRLSFLPVLAGLVLLSAPALAQTSTEVLAARALMSDGDLARSIPELRRLAEAGDPLAQTIYGTTFFYGQEGIVDAQQVLSWLGKAAEQDYAPGISDLAWFHRYGMEGLAPDQETARALYEQAAAMGYPRAAATG